MPWIREIGDVAVGVADASKTALEVANLDDARPLVVPGHSERAVDRQLHAPRVDESVLGAVQPAKPFCGERHETLPCIPRHLCPLDEPQLLERAQNAAECRGGHPQDPAKLALPQSCWEVLPFLGSTYVEGEHQVE